MSDFPGIESFNGDDLIMSATAYYLGRQTISVDAHCKCLIRAWPRLNEGVRDYIKSIVEHEFRREELAKERNYQVSYLGDACDRESWVKLRECWKQ